MTARIIIFDFDGTIADTYDVIVNIANQLADEFGYKAVKQEDLILLKNLSSREIVKQSKISLFKIPFLLRRIHFELAKDIDTIKPIKGIDSALKQLKSDGYCLGIVTSNNKNNVSKFLDKYQLNLFDFIYCNTSLFGKHRIINQAIKENKAEKNKVIYVGDETRDIRSAQKSGISSLAVSWGFNGAKILEAHNPDFLINDLTELIDAIALWSSSCATKHQGEG